MAEIGRWLPGVGGDERAMVVEQGYTWTRVPGSNVDIRVLGTGPWCFGTGGALHQTVARWVLSPRTGQKAINDVSTADNATGGITGTPGSLAGDEELRSGRAAMTESPLFTRDPDHAEFKIALREMRERLDQLSDNLATLRAEVRDLAAEIRRFTSS